jgi:NAD+ kinase
VTSPPLPTEDRRVLVIAHTGREEARHVAGQFCLGLAKHGIVVRLLEREAADLSSLCLPDLEVVQPDAAAASGCEVVIVIGGDGTILRAAELARESSTPLLGVNLGHVGFLAEAESDDVEITIDAVVQRRYSAEERLTIDVSVYRDVGATTMGRANSACALMGTMRSASTSGHTTGPPALKL